MTVFVERNCAVGGCACARWDTWYQARREYALRHPRAKGLEAIGDDNAFSEAVDDLAEELDGEFRHEVPACDRPGCRHGTALAA